MQLILLACWQTPAHDIHGVRHRGVCPGCVFGLLTMTLSRRS